MMTPRRLLACSLVLGLAGMVSSAHAWRTASDLPEFRDSGSVRWPNVPVPYSTVRRPPDGWSETDWLGVVGRAAEPWSYHRCGPGVMFVGAPTESAQIGDGIATVEVLSARMWRSRGYDEFAAATTDVLYEMTDDGQWVIADADILVNGAVDWSAGPDSADLQTALAHEWGHVHGLLHCCEPGGAGGAPACEASTHCDGALMLPFVATSLRHDLAPDDGAGLCTLYPSDCHEDATCPECATNTDCATDQRCELGACVASPDPPHDCIADSDCRSARRCVAGRCLAATIGDPCTDSAECASEECLESGVCTRTCDARNPCPAGYECSTELRCNPVLGTIGSACSQPSECAGDRCIDGSSSAPVCSRACSLVQPCPLGWDCNAVSADYVCTPEQPTGCTASMRPGSDPYGTGTVALVLLLVLRRRSRR